MKCTCEWEWTGGRFTYRPVDDCPYRQAELRARAMVPPDPWKKLRETGEL